MDKWPQSVDTLTKQEIHSCITNKSWQAMRLSLKGVPTTRKLDLLWAWWLAHQGQGRWVRVVVDNYINALKRGGQLNDKLEVVR